MKTEAVLQNKNNKKLALKSTLDLLIMAIPGMLVLFVFNYIPMAGVLIAFKDYNNKLGFFGSKWVGFRNFEFLFKSNDAVRIIRNTLGYNLVFILLGLVCAITVALMLDNVRKKSTLKVYQTAMFLPYFISWVVVGYMTQLLFDYNKGFLNQILAVFGKEPMAWYQEKAPWLVILPITSIWKSIGYNSIIYYGAIMGIDQQLFEAAEIDGCVGIKKIWYITLPLLKPTIIILTILAIGGIMRADFGLFYYIPNNSGIIYETTDVLDTYIFRALRQNGDISVSSAVGLFQSVVGFVLVMLTNYIVGKIEPDNTLV